MNNRVLDCYRQCLLSLSRGNEGRHNVNRKMHNEGQAERFHRQAHDISYLSHSCDKIPCLRKLQARFVVVQVKGIVHPSHSSWISGQITTSHSKS